MDKAFFTKEIRVRFAETDGMAVVYHGRYFEYLEAARIALLDAIGLPYAQLVAEGYHLPVVEVQAKYLNPARFDDIINIELAQPQLKGPRLILTYRITRENETLLEATTTHVFLKDNRAVKPLEKFVEALHNKQPCCG